MKKRMNILVTIVGFVAFTLPTANAQQQVGSGGRALDANQQVGGGGTNQSKFQEDYRLRNDIVTGNVPAGRGLQAPVGYQAPGEFFAPISSDDLFEFRAQSLPSSPVRLNAIQRNRPRSESYRNISIYRQFTDIPAYRTGGVLVSTAQYQPGFGYQVLEPTSTGQGFIVGSDEGIQTAIPQSSVIGVAELPQGRSLEVQASPLLGVRRYVNETNLSSVQNINNPYNPNNSLPEDDETDQPAQLSSGVGTTGEFANAPARIPAGLVLGQQLRLDVNADNEETQAERIQRLEDQIFNRTENKQLKPGEDVYADLLNAVKKDDPFAKPQNQLVAPVQQDDEKTGEEQSEVDSNKLLIPDNEVEANNPLQQQMRDALREPSDKEIEDAERRSKLLRERLQLKDYSNTNIILKSNRPSEEEYRKNLAKLLTKLDYNLPQIESLAGSTDTPFNNHLRKGEKELIDGRYFAAESEYRSATRMNPRNPLARVGLVHAQLGAGLIRSAAHNLRVLFETNPELIAARYNPRLLPSPQRLQWVQSELDSMISNNEAAADPGLMMAYFGYQVGSKQLTRYGLNVMATQAPNDPLLPVLRHIWIDNPNTSTSESKTTTTPAEVPAK
ncbi:tetratricopeptide repeat protein [Poriferisphaera sp. WC338]|uniref:tetratricopeptide repeat protein n=1 Tax=Poriferisphaera sp. WC338 TaxID=3425129 RepID=UPI003D815C47